MSLQVAHDRLILSLMGRTPTHAHVSFTELPAEQAEEATPSLVSEQAHEPVSKPTIPKESDEMPAPDLPLKLSKQKVS